MAERPELEERYADEFDLFIACTRPDRVAFELLVITIGVSLRIFGIETTDGLHLLSAAMMDP